MPGGVMMEKSALSNAQPVNSNGDNGPLTNGDRGHANGGGSHGGDQGVSRMNDLPDEIQHITQGFVPLNLLISRLAQQTHNQLADEIMALAKLPMPSSAMNGNTANGDGSLDDNSPESLNKKVHLLKFIQEKHAEWIKALVICHWSRRAQDVSKLIDLMHHINKTRSIYHTSLDYMINIKRDLTFARVPNPDLKTALQVLSTGQAPWMPDLNYIQPPPLTSEEQLQWIENLNTLLSIRLNLDEHDSIPEPFRDFHIGSGRVTFKVPGEFELDLTIADEDPTTQFWFIDFRFAFQPAPFELAVHLRNALEFKVNEALRTDGLVGCYNFLHEFVLTHKITEYLRQATELSKGRWAGMLEMERLRRAMAIVYWSGRQPRSNPQSYIIMGVSSGRKPQTRPDHKISSSSHLSLRWFRDGVEVKDVKFPLDNGIISTEALLQRVIGKHIEHILTALHTTLKSQQRFSKNEASLAINNEGGHPDRFALRMQLTREHSLTIKVAPITGTYLTKPQVRGNFDLQSQLNKDYRRPVNEQATLLEKFRCHLVEDDLVRRGKSRGWDVCGPPVKIEEIRQILGTRSTYTLTWLKRRGLPNNWYIVLGQSPSGDQWWLMEISQASGSGNARIATHALIPITPGLPRYSDPFFAELTFVSSAMISQIAILGSLHQDKIKYVAQEKLNPVLPTTMKMPSIHVRLSDVLNRHYPREAGKKKASWALDFVEINLRTVENRVLQPSPPLPSTAKADAESDLKSGRSNEQPSRPGSEQHGFSMVADARVKVADPASFGPLKGNVERDVAFNEHLGVFTFTVEAEVGTPILDVLAQRLQALSRLAGSIDAIRLSTRDIRCEEITLGKVSFSYTGHERVLGDEPQQEADRLVASLDLQADNMALVLDPHNPQARAINLFNRLLNSEHGFKNVPYFLSTTLPIHRALGAITTSWKALEATDQGRAIVTAVALDWLIVEYKLGPCKAAGPCLTLHCRMRSYHDRAGWHIFREEAELTAHPDDNFQRALQKVWTADNRTWRRLNIGVGAPTSAGAESLLKIIDDAIRPLAIRSPTLLKQPHPKATASSLRHPGPNRNPAAANRNRPQAQAQAQSQSQPQQQGPIIISLDD